MEHIVSHVSTGTGLSRRALLQGAAFGLSLLSIPALAGCSGNGGSNSGGNKSIQFWSRESFNNGALQPVIDARVAEFDKAHSSTTKTLYMSFADSTQKTQAALAAGNPPSVGQQGPDVSLQFASGGHLAAMDDVLDRLKPKFVDLQKDAFVVSGGKNYAVPWYTETRVLFFHTDLLTKANIAPPTTWDEWLKVTSALSSLPDVSGFCIPGQGTFPGQLFIPLAASQGANLLEADGKLTTSVEPFVETLDFLGRLFKAGMPQSTPTYKETDTSQLFLKKKSATYWYNGQILQAIAAQQPELAGTVDAVVTPTATAGGTSRSFLGGFDLFVFAKGENVDLGKQLVEFLYDPTWYSSYLQRSAGFALPVLKEAASNTFFGSGVVAKLVTQQKTAIRYGGTKFGNVSFLGKAESQQVFSNAVIDVWTGKASPRESVTTMFSRLNTLATS